MVDAMRFDRTAILAATTALLTMTNAAYAAPECDASKVLGVSRTVEIDSATGPRYGRHQYKQTIDLKPGEVVLTFDDGPHPDYTKKILLALEQHCTKATFFSVGTMALAYPETVKLVAKSGHTIGTHTYHHTNLQRVGFKRGKLSIEKGFAALLKASGQPIAPFFRFPYLRRTSKLQSYLASRGIATLSVDVISGDTRRSSSKTILRRTMRLLKQRGKGMILMHDLKKNTARMLPELLNTLKAKGYKIVHIVPKSKVAKPAAIALDFFDRIDTDKGPARARSRKNIRRLRKRNPKANPRPSPFLNQAFGLTAGNDEPSG